ncbi:cuticle protein 19-like [Periplaneta americana]|uniref:cuticle protein 19-like n=1 Tax=Periplaneta americana TaxID=6978 RepID=UPI0037E784AC
MATLAVATIVLVLCAVSFGDHHEEHHHAHPKYEFKYGVKDPHTHDIKEQAEKRDGHKVEGHYMLVEPDGTIRTVHYNADKHTGFHAHVHKTGHAVHPIHHEKVETHHHKTEESGSHHKASSYINSHLHV